MLQSLPPQSSKYAAGFDQFMRLVNQSPLAMIEWDCEQRIARWSKRCEEIFGWKAEEVIGKNVFEIKLVYEADLQSIEGMVEDFVSARIRSGSSRNRNYTKDGRILTIDWHNSAVFDPSGRLLSVLSFAEDVTEEVRAQEALARSQRELHSVVTSMFGAYFRIDREWRFIDINPAAESLFNRSRSELIGKTVWKAFPDIENSKFERQLRHAMNESVAMRFEDRSRILNRWLEACLSPVSDGLMVFLQDIHERKRFEEQLSISNERLQLAVAGSGIGIWDYPFETGKVIWSDQAQAIFGYEAGKFPGTIQAFRDRVHPDDIARVEAASRTLFTTNEGMELEYRIVRPDGEERWVRVIGRLRRHSNGKPLRVTGTVIDITGERKLEADLKAAKGTAESASALKSAFLANMSHEIRSPLGAILGFTELMADPSIGDEERNEYFEIITRNGQHLLALIDEILDLSKVEAGRLEVEMVPCSVRVLLEDVISTLQYRAVAKGLELKLDIGKNVPDQIQSDPVRLKQIVSNLIGNAIKFTDHGEVSVEATGITSDQGNLKLEVRVRDTGIGLTEESRKRLFEPFVQADETMRRKFGGTGLGLALARRLARLLGGDVALVRSEPGHGSEFATWVDTHTSVSSLEEGRERFADLGGDRGAHREEAHPLSGKRILVADDSPDNLTLMKRMLGKKGAEVDTAGDGQEAVEKALRGNYDLVLMDIQMPRMDGYDATRRLRTASYRIPVIALTAHAMKEERQKCLEAGCDDHLAKPVNPNDLMHVIERLT